MIREVSSSAFEAAMGPRSRLPRPVASLQALAAPTHDCDAWHGFCGR